MQEMPISSCRWPITPAFLPAARSYVRPLLDCQGVSQKMMKDILIWKFLSFTVAIKFYSLVAIAAGILSPVFWRLHASL